MTTTSYWHKQTADQPLFPDLLWSKPENKQHAGKLLIIGGHAHGFTAPAESYAAAQKSGIGVSRVLLPDHIRPQLIKFYGPHLETEFAPSTPSGGFGAKALAEFLDVANWADGVLLAGDFGRNSETAVVLEKLVAKTTMPLVITKDGIDYFTNNSNALLARGKVCIVLTIAQLQKFVSHAKFATPITFSMDLLRLVDALHEFTTQYPIHIITKHHDNLVVASQGQVSTTKTSIDIEAPWRVVAATNASVWWLQNPGKPFEAFTTSLI